MKIGAEHPEFGGAGWLLFDRPLALFFACKANSKDGELLIFSVKNSEIKLFDSDTVSAVTNIVKPYDFDIDCKVHKVKIKISAIANPRR